MRRLAAAAKILSVPILLTLLFLLWRLSPGLAALESSLPAPVFSLPGRLLAGFRALVFYISLILAPLPGRLALEHDFRPPVPWADSLAAATFVILGAAYAVRVRRKKPLAAFGIGWFILFLIPETFLVPPLAPAYEHRLYLPLPGLLAPAAYFLARAGHRGLLAACAIVLLLAGLTIDRNRDWRDAVTLWRDTVEKSPRLARPRNNLGWSLNGAGRLDEALEQLRIAVRLDPRMADAHHNLGVVLHKKGRIEEALEEYRAALALDPRHAKAHEDLAVALFETGRQEEALEEFARAAALSPFDAGPVYNRALALQRLGRVKEAERFYRRALRLDPGHLGARMNLGRMLLEEGRCAEAAEALEPATARERAAGPLFERAVRCVKDAGGKTGGGGAFP